MPDSILSPARAQWFDLRFIEDSRKTRCECQVCARPMWFPPSKAGRYVTCGGECSAKRYALMGNPARHVIPEKVEKRKWNCRGCGAEISGGKATKKFCSASCLSSFRIMESEALAKERTRTCKKCGKYFVAKKSQIDFGQGVYCSQRCNFESEGFDRLNAPEIQKKSVVNRRISIAKNGTKHRIGHLSPMWKGGMAASLARGRPRARQKLKEYRKNNPEKVREFTKRRSGRIIGRLPKGLLKKIGNLQKWKCIVCHVSIKSNYHIDHVMPLAKGGQHEAINIQLLCPSCNLHKSAKHPVDFMQSKGFLL